jgi:hypothetical protein
MATKKITDLVELISAASGDVLPIVDISDDITKKIQVNNLLASKQDTLVSGTNIKTLNSESLLGSGNIEITASPSGVGGAIQFSNGSAFASDAANLFWDDTNNRLGIGTNAPTLPIDILGGTSNGGLKVRAGNTTSQNILDIANNAGTKGWVYRAGDGVLQFYGGNFQIESQSSSGHIVLATGNGSGGVGINVSSPTARLQVKGSGTTSSTTSLLVQNSAGTELLKVTDDSVTNARGTMNVLHPSVATRSLKLGWGSIFATDSGSELTLGAVFAVSSSPQILLAGNTRSSGANTMQLQASAGVSIATSVMNPNAQLHVKGSGTTSATTSLLVQNSAGTQFLQVNDAGDLFFNGLETSSMRIHTLGNTNKGISIDNEIDMGAFYGITFKTWDGSAYSNFMRINSDTAARGLIIGGTTNDASAKLQIDSTTQGFLPPRMTTTQKNAISTPASGLMVYDTDTNKLCCYNGTSWNDLF